MFVTFLDLNATPDVLCFEFLIVLLSTKVVFV